MVWAGTNGENKKQEGLAVRVVAYEGGILALLALPPEDVAQPLRLASSEYCVRRREIMASSITPFSFSVVKESDGDSP